MELSVNLGVSSVVEQFRRRCVPGRKGILCKPAWRCRLPGKAQLAPWLLFNEDDFLFSVSLSLVELGGSPGCCVEVGCLGPAC